MKVVRFIVDNSTVLLGAATALFGVLAAFGLKLSSEQVGAIMGLAGAVFLILGAAVSTAKRKVVSLVTSGGNVVAGQAAAQSTGSDALVLEKGGAKVVVTRVKRALAHAA